MAKNTIFVKLDREPIRYLGTKTPNIIHSVSNATGT